MRRSDREVTEVADIEGIIRRCQVCRLAMVDGDAPYVVPLNFGYALDTAARRLELAFHGALEGRKVDVLRRDPRVCFEMDIPHGLLDLGGGRFSYRFESVIGSGRAVFAESHAEKRRLLGLLLAHMTGKGDWPLPDGALDATCAFSVVSTDFTAKRRAP